MNSIRASIQQLRGFLPGPQWDSLFPPGPILWLQLHPLPCIRISVYFSIQEYIAKKILSHSKMSPTAICPEEYAANPGINSRTMVAESWGCRSRRIPNPVMQGSNRLGGGVSDAKRDLSRAIDLRSFSLEGLSHPDRELADDWCLL